MFPPLSFTDGLYRIHTLLHWPQVVQIGHYTTGALNSLQATSLMSRNILVQFSSVSKALEQTLIGSLLFTWTSVDRSALLLSLAGLQRLRSVSSHSRQHPDATLDGSTGPPDWNFFWASQSCVAADQTRISVHNVYDNNMYCGIFCGNAINIFWYMKIVP